MGGYSAGPSRASGVGKTRVHCVGDGIYKRVRVPIQWVWVNMIPYQLIARLYLMHETFQPQSHFSQLLRYLVIIIGLCHMQFWSCPTQHYYHSLNFMTANTAINSQKRNHTFLKLGTYLQRRSPTTDLLVQLGYWYRRRNCGKRPTYSLSR